MRETDSRLIRPRKDHFKTFPTLGVQTAHQEADTDDSGTMQPEH